MNCHVPDNVLNVALAHFFEDLCRHLIILLHFLLLVTVFFIFCIQFMFSLVSFDLKLLALSIVDSNWLLPFIINFFIIVIILLDFSR